MPSKVAKNALLFVLLCSEVQFGVALTSFHAGTQSNRKKGVISRNICTFSSASEQFCLQSLYPWKKRNKTNTSMKSTNLQETSSVRKIKPLGILSVCLHKCKQDQQSPVWKLLDNLCEKAVSSAWISINFNIIPKVSSRGGTNLFCALCPY